MKVKIMIEKLQKYNQDADVFIEWPGVDEDGSPGWNLDSVDYILSDALEESSDVKNILLCPLSEDDRNEWDNIIYGYDTNK